MKTVIYQPLAGYSISGYRNGQSYELDDALADSLLSTGMFVQEGATDDVVEAVEASVISSEDTSYNSDDDIDTEGDDE